MTLGFNLVLFVMITSAFVAGAMVLDGSYFRTFLVNGGYFGSAPMEGFIVFFLYFLFLQTVVCLAPLFFLNMIVSQKYLMYIATISSAMVYYSIFYANYAWEYFGWELIRDIGIIFAFYVYARCKATRRTEPDHEVH